jgi:hypothetical protein
MLVPVCPKCNGDWVARFCETCNINLIDCEDECSIVVRNYYGAECLVFGLRGQVCGNYTSPCYLIGSITDIWTGRCREYTPLESLSPAEIGSMIKLFCVFG